MHGSGHAKNLAFGDLVVVGAMAVAADRLGQDLPLHFRATLDPTTRG